MGKGRYGDIIDWDKKIQEADIEDIDSYLTGLPEDEAGRVIHSWLRETFSDYKTLRFENFCYDHTRNFKGKYDAFDGEVTYEFKTKNGYALDSAPFDEDIQQLNNYLNALDSDLGVLVYISRDDLTEVNQYLIARQDLT